MGVPLPVVSFVLVLVSTTPAAAANEPLARAAEAFEAMDYDEMLDLLAEADRLPMTRAERGRYWELQGICHAIYGRDDLAREAFFQLLMIEPDYTAGATASPKILVLLEQARARRKSETAPVPSPAEPGPNEREIRPPQESATESDAVSPLPPAALAAPPAADVAAAPEESAPEPAIYERWYFWVGVAAGVLVAGGVTAGVVAAQDPYPPHDFDPIELRP